MDHARSIGLLMAAAVGGTGGVFLDEIGDMPSALQTKLLRVLEDGVITPVGASQDRRVDVRVIAATNVDLPAKIQSGTFRQDLYFRLARTTMQVPSLRERLDDIPLLADHFLKLLTRDMGRQPPKISCEAQALLQAHSWPGNIRELRNIIENAIIMSGGSSVIRPDHLRFTGAVPGIKGSTHIPPGLPWDLEELEKEWMRRALKATSDNIAQAAKLLGVDRSRIYRRLPL